MGLGPQCLAWHNSLSILTCRLELTLLMFKRWHPRSKPSNRNDMPDQPIEKTELQTSH